VDGTTRDRDYTVSFISQSSHPASLIQLFLHFSKVVTMFIRESEIPTAFGRKLAVCLFDCIVAEFSQMILHGRQIEENAVLRDTAWKLLRCFPKTLSVFTIDESIQLKEALVRLRSQILKDRLTRLYPAVFFSFFTSFSSEVLQEV